MTPAALLRVSLIPAFFLMLVTADTGAAVSVTDDRGREVRLEKPARRIVSLSPHITESLFAAGAGDHIVGTVRYSDYPESAENIPRVGDTYNLDIERIIELQPDLVIVWHSGTPSRAVETIEKSGFPVYHSEPRSLEAITETLRDFGRLAGTSTAAKQRSNDYMERLTSLRSRYTERETVSVFYQFWHRPIYTVNGDHLINRVIELCGGRNVFAGLAALTPRVDRESVLDKDPDVIIASGEDASRPSWLHEWRDWPDMQAVKNGHIYSIPPDLLLRHTPRILEGAEKMCRFIEHAR